MRPGWLLLAIALGSAGSARADGRIAELTLGGGAATTAGDGDPPAIPALLRHAPELQLGLGLHLGDLVLLTRLDLLGAMVPIGPAGIGVDVGGGWYPGHARAGWAPVARAFVGGVLFGSGGEMLGPDHASRGVRLAAEAGLVRRHRVAAGRAGWGVLLGAQATALTAVRPCSPSSDCDAVLLGATARLAGHLTF
jgi:hypothetical protein